MTDGNITALVGLSLAIAPVGHPVIQGLSSQCRQAVETY